MNKRIRLLAEQAGIKINPRRLYWDDEPDGYLESDNDFILNNQEIVIKVLEGDALKKLAELIIRECAVYVKNSNCFTYASQADLCSERMKEHFGVEE
jgi:hypothetical protein